MAKQKRDTDCKLKKKVTLQLGCIYLTTYYKPDGSRHIGFANDKLWDHNIGLDVFPEGGRKLATNTIDYGSKPIPDTLEDYRKLHDVAKAKLRKAGCMYSNPLVVVFCQFQQTAYGVAPDLKSKLLRLALIAPHAIEDGDLLHEMGHTVGLHHDSYIKSPRNFMDTVGSRETVYCYQVDAFGKAVYGVG